MSLSAAILRSDRKAAQILGVTVARDDARTGSFVKTLKARFSRKHHRSPPSSEEEDALVWDVPNPFAEPDPELAHVHALIQVEINHVRRYEHVGPLDSIHAARHADYDDDGDVDDSADDADDEDDEDTSEDDELERLFQPIPLLIPSPSQSTSPSPPSTPPPTPTVTSFDEDSFNNVYPDVDEHTHRRKRDAHRSRAKALAILGPEASAAL